MERRDLVFYVIIIFEVNKVNKSKGILYIILSAFFFSIMAASVKSVPDLPLSQKIFFRNFVGLVAVSLSLLKTKTSIKIHHPKLMLMRASFGLIGVGLYYAALERLPLADAVVLNNLSPIFVMIFAVIFLNEKIKKGQKYAIGIGLLGALLVIKPTFSLTVLPALLALLSAVFAGAAYTIIRKLTIYDRPQVIVFYFCLLSSIVLVPFMMIEGFVIPSLKEWLGLLGIGISAFVAQMALTNGYKNAPASEISVYSYTNFIFSILWGVMLFQELPDGYSLLGGLFILFAGIMNYHVTKVSQNIK